MPRELKKANSTGSMDLLESSKSKESETKLRQSLRTVGFDTGAELLKPKDVMKGPPKDEPLPHQKETKATGKDEPVKNDKPKVDVEKQEKQEYAKTRRNAVQAVRSDLATAALAKTPEERAERFAKAFMAYGIPQSLRATANRVALQVLAMGALKATSGHRNAFKGKQKSLKWSMTGASLLTEEKFGMENASLGQRARHGLAKFANGVRGRMNGDLSRSKVEKRENKLDEYRKLCIESVKATAQPVLQEYQLFCLEALQRTGEDVSTSDFAQLVLECLGSLRTETAMDEQQVDHGGEAQSHEDEMQKARSLY